MLNRVISRWVAIGLPILLCLAACLLWPGVSGPFLFDDEPNLKNLAELQGLPDWRRIGVYLSLFPDTPGRPLSALSFILNDAAWPSDPFGFKLTNLLIHLLNGALVFGLARTLARAWQARPSMDVADRHPDSADVVALACAAIWMLNPIQVSAVFLTVQRMTELAATFVFAGLWGFFALVPRATTFPRVIAALAVLGLGTILAFLCKENGALAPLLAWVAIATMLAPTMRELPNWPRRMLHAGVGLPALLVMLKLLQIVGQLGASTIPARGFSMPERLLTQARVLLDYASIIAFPRLSGSSLYNDDFELSRGLLEPATTLPAVLTVLAALAAALALLRRKPLFSFAMLWFLAGHLTESSVVPLELYFEHRNYVPLFGPALALALWVTSVRGKLRAPVLAGFCLWLGLCAIILHQQARAWGDEGLLATLWHVERPNSLRAQQQYASWLFKQGRPQEARAVMITTMQHDVSPVSAMLQAITVDCALARRPEPNQLAEARALLRTEQLNPGTAAIMARLREDLLAGRCRNTLAPEDWFAMSQAILDNPRGRGIWRMIRIERTEVWLAANRLDDAIDELRIAYGRGGEPRIAFYAAALLATAGRYDEARIWASKPQGRPWSWKRWLAGTDQQARELVEAINEAETSKAQ